MSCTSTPTSEDEKGWYTATRVPYAFVLPLHYLTFCTIVDLAIDTTGADTIDHCQPIVCVRFAMRSLLTLAILMPPVTTQCEGEGAHLGAWHPGPTPHAVREQARQPPRPFLPLPMPSRRFWWWQGEAPTA